ncbi:hypothetical protein [Bacillus infantis]|jgi:hypothetical protein|nr:hypothetical protein [Bacillus infantis]
MKKRIFAILAVMTLLIGAAGVAGTGSANDGGARTLELPSVH